MKFVMGFGIMFCLISILHTLMLMISVASQGDIGLPVYNMLEIPKAFVAGGFMLSFFFGELEKNGVL